MGPGFRRDDGQGSPALTQEFLDLGEEAIGLRMGAAAFLVKFLEQLLLPLSQVNRRFDCDLDIKVATAGAPQNGHAFAAQPELRQNLRVSFLRMLRFYGLEMKSGAVQPAANFQQRAANWLQTGNHNHLRITRILKSLTLLGLAEESGALLECLETICAEHPGKISAVSLRFWRAAIEPE